MCKKGYKTPILCQICSSSFFHCRAAVWPVFALRCADRERPFASKINAVSQKKSQTMWKGSPLRQAPGGFVLKLTAVGAQCAGRGEGAQQQQS